MQNRRTTLKKTPAQRTMERDAPGVSIGTRR